MRGKNLFKPRTMTEYLRGAFTNYVDKILYIIDHLGLRLFAFITSLNFTATVINFLKIYLTNNLAVFLQNFTQLVKYIS